MDAPWFIFFGGQKMQWLMLLIAGTAEVTWAVAMKYSAGFTKLWPSVVTVVFYILSAVFLSMALKKLPLGTAYAMWTGFGIVGTSILGVMLFKEALSIPQIICIIMIAGGIVGLKVL
jgi:quaternary ammonium compound-resistance protein SugE